MKKFGNLKTLNDLYHNKFNELNEKNIKQDFSQRNSDLSPPPAQIEQNRKNVAYRKLTGDSAMAFIQLSTNWNLIVGEVYAKISRPTLISKNILYIATAHSIFSQDLNLRQNVIISKVISHFPILSQDIKKLFFQVRPQLFQVGSPKDLKNSLSENNGLIDTQKFNQEASPNFYKKNNILKEKKNLTPSTQEQDVDEIKEMLRSLAEQIHQK